MNDLEFGVNLPTMIVAIAFLAAFASVMAVTLPFVRSGSFTDRLKSVAVRREELRALKQEQFQQRKRLMPTRQEGLMRAIINLFKMDNLLQAKDLRAQLIRAGWRQPSTPVRFIFARITLPFVLALGSYLYVGLLWPDDPIEKRLAIALVAAAFGYFLPILLLRNAVTKRQLKLRRAFPDTLDLMCICVEAGM